ncbi:PEP-CTERM sorting domain-containing protein [Kiritimatiellota bacterium B12222]|nr:PEP-CTERM sorting domain-containing protein [Kiritimatiellota bacterium B12222]
MNYSTKSCFTLFLTIFCGATLLQAAVITQIRSEEAGTHWNQATTGGNDVWSDGNAASGTNDYVNNAYTLRTPTSSSTFNGKSLTLETGGSLLLKPNGAGRVYTVNDLILDGGKIIHGQPSITTSEIAGNITLLSDSIYDASGSSYRRATISASITGSSVFDITLGNSDRLEISSVSNNFSGLWQVNQYGTENVTSYGFVASGDGSLGNASVFIDTLVAFDVDYDIYNPTKSLTMNGEMILDQDHTFGSVSIGGNALAAGTYTFADLNSSFDANFRDGGTGSITVIPESSSLALMLLSVCGLCMGLRKRR